MTEQQIYDAAYRGSYNGTIDAQKMFSKPLLSQVEFARLIGKSVRTVQRWINDGKIESGSGGKIPRTELDKLKI